MSGVVQAQDGTSSTGEETKDYTFTCLAFPSKLSSAGETKGCNVNC